MRSSIDVSLQHLKFRLARVEHPCHDRRDEPLRERNDVLEVGVGHLRFDHPELGEMAPRLRLLGAEGRAEAVDLAERHRVRLVVELAALGEEGLGVLEVLHGKQRGRPLTGRGRENRRVAQDEAAGVEEVTDRVDDFVPDPQNSGLPFRADPKVPAVHQVIDAMLLRGNREVVGGAVDLDRLRIDLVPPFGPRVGSHRAGDRERRLL
jgi:hypothetical protein